jgi:hypothetical protein
MYFPKCLLGLLLTIPLSASVTYEFPGIWSFTVPDFLAGDTIRIPGDALNYCPVNTGDCSFIDSVNFQLQGGATNVPTYVTWVLSAAPNSIVGAVAVFHTDLRTPGVFGSLTITQQGNSQVASAPEPISYALCAVGMGLLAMARRRLTAWPVKALTGSPSRFLRPQW